MEVGDQRYMLEFQPLYGNGSISQNVSAGFYSTCVQIQCAESYSVKMVTYTNDGNPPRHSYLLIADDNNGKSTKASQRDRIQFNT